MVRTKNQAGRKTSTITPIPGKALLIEKNRLFGTPPKTPKSSRGSLSAQSKSPNDTLLNSQNKSKSKSQNSTLKKSTTVKRRARPGVKAIREIRAFQKSTNLLIPKASFSRVVREVLQNQPHASDFRFSTMALMALQEATEMAIVNLLEVANLCCIHARRVTLAPSDIRLTRRAFGLAHPVND